MDSDNHSLDHRNGYSLSKCWISGRSSVWISSCRIYRHDTRNECPVGTVQSRKYLLGLTYFFSSLTIVLLSRGNKSGNVVWVDLLGGGIFWALWLGGLACLVIFDGHLRYKAAVCSGRAYFDQQAASDDPNVSFR
jgi:hypothetical protein